MRKILIVGIIVFLVNGLADNLWAQNYPATATLQLLPPFSINLEDYASPGIDRTFVSAVFNDFSQSSWEVKFRFTISNGDVTLQTNPDAVFPAIRLEPGILEQYTGFDLEEYLNYNNMVLSGVDRASIQERGGLPEGMYTFTLEILDYRTGIRISNKATAIAMMFLNDPPQISLPYFGDQLLETDPQDILFQWLPMHQGSPNSAFTTSYDLSIVEVPNGLNPEEAMRSGLPIFETTSDLNNFYYDVSAPLLESGKTYAYRIRAIDEDNLGLFKNDGFSAVSYFKFGVNTDGDINLVMPEDDAIVSGDSRLVFKWDGPDNLSYGQRFNYQFKIVEVEENQDTTDAILMNPSYYEDEFPETVSDKGFSFVLPEALETEKTYAWQVSAISGNIEIARSSIHLLNSAPKLNSFNAGQHIVKINTLTNENFNNLAGKGTIKLHEDGTEYKIEFSGLKLRVLAGKLFLESGVINHPLPETFPDITLSPSNEANGDASFYAESITLDRDNLKITGRAKWPLPFPVQSGEMAYVTTQKTSMKFNNLKLNGYMSLDSTNVFQLLDPFGFDLTLTPSSNIFITDDNYRQNFNAEILLPEDIKSPEKGRVMAKLNSVQQLFSNQISELEQPIVPIKGLNIHLIPTLVHVDLSSEKSPGTFASDESWMGLYFEKFDIQYLKNVDDQQLTFDQVLTHPFETDETTEAWADGEGLRLLMNKTFDETAKNFARFNKFHGKIQEVALAIQQGILEKGEIKGSIDIPVLNNDSFEYLIPISNEGFEEGYLLEELTGKQYTMGSGEQDKVNLVLGQAVFAENERLFLSISLEWPDMQLDAGQIHDFRIWGNGQIGFKIPYGSAPLSNQISGVIHGYEIIGQSVNAGFADSNYYFGVTSTITIDEDISGPNGPPVTTVYSAKGTQVEKDTSWFEATVKLPSFSPSPAGLDRGVRREGDLVIDSTQVTFDIGLAKAEGYVHLTTNDPDWGNSWRGLLTVTTKAPVKFEMKASFIIGQKDDFSYYFFEGGLAVDGSSDKLNARVYGKKSRKFKVAKKIGNGIPLGPLSITGADLRFYKKMAHSDSTEVQDGGADVEIKFLPDESNSYGIYGRVAGQDTKESGDLVKFDVAFEYSENTGGDSRYAFEGNLDIADGTGKGNGRFIYDEGKSFYHGAGKLEINVPGKLCGKGGLAITVSPSYWQVNVGSEEEKIVIIPGCRGLIGSGFLEIKPDQFNLGLGFGKTIGVKSPEVTFLGNDFVGRAEAGFVFGGIAGMCYKPTVSITRFGCWVEAWAGVYVDYDTWFDSGTVTIASAKLSGNADVYFEPQQMVSGTLNVEVEVIGIDVEFDMGIRTSF